MNDIIYGEVRKIGQARWKTTFSCLLLFSFFFLPMLVLAQIKTTVTDSLLGPDGSPATGTMTISATGAFESADGHNVAQGWRIQVPVSGGSFTVNLIPNVGATPFGQNDSYVVIYNLTSSLGTGYWSETWFVPSTGPVGLAAVRTLPSFPASFLSPQAANTVLSGPAAGGSPGPAVFRPLVGADLPFPSANSLGGVQSVTCTNGQFVNQISTAGAPGCGTPGGGSGSGSVTSVGLSLPSIFSVTGSPVTGSGTLTAALTSETANQFLASPDGNSGSPRFRSLVTADLPALISSNTTGNAATATALASSPFQCSGNNWATGVATSGNANCSQPSFANLSGAATAAQVPAISGLTGSATCSQLPALTGDATMTAGTCATSVTKVNGSSLPLSSNALGTNASGQIISESTAGTAVYAAQYGVIPDGRFIPDANTTNGSQTVTCPNSDCNFTSADVGKIVFGTIVPNNYNGGANMNGTLVIPQGTITAVNSANSITVSNAATSTHTWVLNVVAVTLVWGSDNSSALANAFTAATSVTYGPCAPIVLPAGLMLVQQAEFINAPANCLALVADNREGIKVIGQGQSATQLVPTPNFNFTTCTGPHNGCFGDNYVNPTWLGDRATYNGGTYFKDWSIWGGNYAGANPSSAKAIAVVGHNAVYENWACMGWGGEPSGATSQGNLGGAYIYGTPSLMTNFQIDGCGSAYNIEVVSGAYASINGQSFFGDSVGTPVLITGGELKTFGMNTESPNYTDGGGNTYNVYQTGGTWFSNGDVIGAGTDAGAHQATVTVNSASAKAVLTNCKLLNPVAASTGTDIYVEAGLVEIGGCLITESGAGGVGIYVASGGTLIDMGGNTVSATTLMTNLGSFQASPSITGTALTASKVALTSGWGSGTVGSVAGDSHGGAFTITEAGSPGASPVITLTFPTAYWVAPAYCTINQTAGNFTLSNPVTSSLTATGVVFTFNGTPAATDSYTFAYRCGP